jgi:hypothetical protein
VPDGERAIWRCRGSRRRTATCARARPFGRPVNDLLRLEEDLQTAAAQYHERMQAEESKPIPKTKKHYKQLKEREERKSQT